MSKRQNSSRKRKSVASLPVIRPRVAGIDIGSRAHFVAGPIPEDGSMNVREFGTTTPQLQAMVDWLLAQGVESVAMESTNIYWIPAYEMLETHGVEVLLVNARQISKIPGRKTDVMDYVDIGEQAYDAQFEERRLKGMKSTLASMGYNVVPMNAPVEVPG
jgi:transposase